MRVLLADDHDLVRDSLVTLIGHYSAGSKVVGVDSLDAALATLSKDHSFDLVILDLHMPGMNGLAGLRQLIADWPQVPVALMSGGADSEDVMGALAMGARGYLPKTMAGRGLVQALELIVAGEIFLPSTVLRSGTTIRQPQGMTLTQREQQVLENLKDGLSNKAIALRLGVHEATVKLHLRTLSKKLGAKNRTDLLFKAMERGFVK